MKRMRSKEFITVETPSFRNKRANVGNRDSLESGNEENRIQYVTETVHFSKPQQKFLNDASMQNAPHSEE